MSALSKILTAMRDTQPPKLMQAEVRMEGSETILLVEGVWSPMFVV